jgi:hypothetical protein
MGRRVAGLVAVLLCGVLVAAACSSDDGGSSSDDSAPDEGATVEGLPADLPLNQMQVIGSHNSYHVGPTAEQLVAIAEVDAQGAEELDYSHEPLAVQLEDQAVRQFELDVTADSQGGLYAEPTGAEAAGYVPADHPEMYEPGIKVLHIPEIDFSTTCTTFVLCLEEVAGWSADNPNHVPITILVEAKADASFSEPWDEAALSAIDEEIRSVFSDEQLLTPDDVRGDRATLEEAVLEDGWPTLGEAQGQVMFLLDNEGDERDAYLAGNPSLEGRVLFVSSPPGEPSAAFMKRNDPLDADADADADIEALVEAGYVVRTRADEPTFQARSGDTEMRDAALASGAQWVSTDFPAVGLAERYGSDYVAQIPGGVVARCNPVNAPPSCTEG